MASPSSAGFLDRGDANNNFVRSNRWPERDPPMAPLTLAALRSPFILKTPPPLKIPPKISALRSQHRAPDDLPSVLLLCPLPAFDAALAQRFRFLKPWESPIPREEFFSAHADFVRALLCAGPARVDSDTIARLPRLELVVAASAGVNHIDIVECRRRGIAVTNAGDIFADDAADYAVGMLIDVLQRVSAADRYLREGRWPVMGECPLGSKLGGKRVGIIGLGSIGSRVAKRLEAFGCIISYYSRTKKPSTSYRYFSTVLDLASDSDVLIVTCSLTTETHHIVNREVMLALGKEGIIINVGRGALIDEKELVCCLMEGEIGGAGLDVFENEPVVPEELLQMDNVVLSHHKAVFTADAFKDLLQVVIDNLEAFCSDKPLVTPVLD